jgi:hypothetical protein
MGSRPRFDGNIVDGLEATLDGKIVDGLEAAIDGSRLSMG